MDRKTIVLPSARAIRHEQFSLKETTLFLPNFITMNEFISKLCRVKEYKFIDDDTRILLLLEASEFKEFATLQIERNFFTFTKNSSYIFKFFGEISAELYDINLLSNADLYGEYEEHISILIELYKRYKKICQERKYLDRIFIPKLYEFNSVYAASHKNIVLKVDGHLTNFEFKLLEECCKQCEVILIFTTTAFNTKMQSRFEAMGILLEVGYSYQICLNTKIIEAKKRVIKNSNVTCESLSEPLLQVAFVKNKLYEFVQKGYSPEKIAVILPNESIAEQLRSFDVKSNLNFAMGEPFSKSEIYTKIQATTKAIELDSHENRARVLRLGETLRDKLVSVYYKESKEIDFVSIMKSLQVFFTHKKEVKIFEEEIFSFEKLLPFMQSMSFKSLLNLFMQRLAGRTLDDVRGGKVTVMGVLETRSISFDGVIIVDFDEKNVPKRSDKDMFLNSQIRELANLPTMSDRENLQKHYYEMLINASKEVALCYVSGEQGSGSHFLKQLGIDEKSNYDALEYANILFKHQENKRVHFEDITYEYTFRSVKLSATRLKTFLTCKRKYYLKYIQHLKNHTIPTDMPQEYEIGIAVHHALKELYSKKPSYNDAILLQKDLEKELDTVCGKSELDSYLIAIQKRKLRAFVQNEILRFSEGWSVYATEEAVEVSFCGMQIVGTIDRIDKYNNEVAVLDYKTGSYPLYTKNNLSEATDFQLEFYKLLAGGIGNVVACGFYDLKESQIVPEAFLDEKVAILQSHIKDLLQVQELDTKMCEDEKNCIYCEYAVLCQRA